MLQQKANYVLFIVFILCVLNKCYPNYTWEKKKRTQKGHQGYKAKLLVCDTIKIFHAVLIWPTCEYAF